MKAKNTTAGNASLADVVEHYGKMLETLERKAKRKSKAKRSPSASLSQIAISSTKAL